MKIQFASICDIGLKARENQDRILCLADEQAGLFAVADGMGGLENGSFASQTIRGELEAWWHRYFEETSPVDGEKSSAEGLRKALIRANEEIIKGTPKGSRCGSTVVALLLEEDRYTVLSCGDSRCYAARKKILFTEMECLTRDDIWENQESNIKHLSAEQIRKHKNRGKLVRAVGTGKEFTCSVRTGKLSPREVFLLCSDGMHKRVSSDDVKQAMGRAFSGTEEKLKACCGELKEKVYRNGAGDNISIILVRCGE